MDIKDSGKRQQFASGMVRDTTEGKIDFTLALDGPMFQRYAEHLTKGAQKYEKRNWMKANDQEAYDRFRESALRHLMQWLRGDRDEDHAAAVIFNLNGAEYVREKLATEGGDVDKLYVDLDKTKVEPQVKAIVSELSEEIANGDYNDAHDRGFGITSRQVTALIALLVRKGIL